jgi:hypothetical protein
MLNRNKKAAIGETLTWTVATFIIVTMIILFLFFSGLMARLKSVSVDSGNIAVDGEDLIESKTSLALDIEDAKEDYIEDWIKEEKKYG